MLLSVSRQSRTPYNEVSVVLQTILIGHQMGSLYIKLPGTEYCPEFFRVIVFFLK